MPGAALPAGRGRLLFVPGRGWKKSPPTGGTKWGIRPPLALATGREKGYDKMNGRGEKAPCGPPSSAEFVDFDPSVCAQRHHTTVGENAR
ncbi:hypothetical protein HMPREF0262_03717 [Clostridium sp. ATCC 29733]|nr:hypothetical protein HMPREF0262_03717 [Clostridium sp. ATCC 29733]